MTVAELIERLKEMPQDLEVFLNVHMSCREGYASWWNSVFKVYVKEEPDTVSPFTRFVTIQGGKNEP